MRSKTREEKCDLPGVKHEFGASFHNSYDKTRSTVQGRPVSLELRADFSPRHRLFYTARAGHDAPYPGHALIQVIVFVVPGAHRGNLRRQALFFGLAISPSRCLAAISSCRILAVTWVLACASLGKAEGAATSSSIRVSFAQATTNRSSGES